LGKKVYTYKHKNSYPASGAIYNNNYCPRDEFMISAKFGGNMICAELERSDGAPVTRGAEREISGTEECSKNEGMGGWRVSAPFQTPARF
jgi:hypothetical protein